MKSLPLIITDIDNYTPPQTLYDHIVAQHIKTQYIKGNNFKIKDTKEKDLDNLYQHALNKISLMFNFKLLDSNSRDCWAYVLNKGSSRNGIHNHNRTSVINMVYYLYVPKSKDYRDGAIAIYENENENSELFCYRPRTGDLLVMPNWLLHNPLITHCEEYRISINMEIMCEIYE